MTVTATCSCGERGAAPAAHDLSWDQYSVKLGTEEEAGTRITTRGPAGAAGEYTFRANCSGATDKASLITRTKRVYRAQDDANPGNYRMSFAGYGACMEGGKVFVGDRITLYYEVDGDLDEYRDSPDGPWIPVTELGKYNFKIEVSNGNASFSKTEVMTEAERSGLNTGNLYLYVRAAGDFSLYLTLTDETEVNAPDEGTRKDETFVWGPGNPLTSFTAAAVRPESLLQTGTAVSFEAAAVNSKASFIYEGLPHSPPAYENVVIDEEFLPLIPYGIGLDDIEEGWKEAHPEKSKDISWVINYIARPVRNSSFTVNARNEFDDHHDGYIVSGYPLLPEMAMKTFGCILPQRYASGDKKYPSTGWYHAYYVLDLLTTKNWKTHAP